METSHPHSPALIPPVATVLAAIVSAQGGAAIAKGLFPVLGAPTTAGLRIALSAVMLLGAFRPPLGRLTAAQWKLAIPFGMCLGLMNMVFYLSLARIPLGLAVTIEFLGPLGVAVFGSRRPLDLLWVVMAGAGIALIAPWSGTGVDPLGVLYALLAGLCWATYIVLGSRLSRLVARGGSAVSAGMVVATLTVLPLVLASGGLARDDADADLQDPDEPRARGRGAVRAGSPRRAARWGTVARDRARDRGESRGDGDVEAMTMKTFPTTSHMRWRRIDVPGREEARIEQTAHGWRLMGELEVEEGSVGAQLAYLIECDRDWRTRWVVVTGLASGAPVRLKLGADGAGHWTLNGAPLSMVEGALDIDLGFTPATNLLPIRRLALAVGERADVRTAWVRFPELRVEALEQSYLRDAARVFRYDALVDGERFQARLDTDEFGRVLHYEGLWEAESTSPGPDRT